MKKKLSFETFTDGLCSLWVLDKSKRPSLLLKNVRFRERTVGERRNFDAEQAGHTVQMLIRIPRVDAVKSGVFVTIGDRQFKILQVQHIMDTLPQCLDLTLENPDILIRFAEEEAGSGGRL